VCETVKNNEFEAFADDGRKPAKTKLQKQFLQIF